MQVSQPERSADRCYFYRCFQIVSETHHKQVSEHCQEPNIPLSGGVPFVEDPLDGEEKAPYPLAEEKSMTACKVLRLTVSDRPPGPRRLLLRQVRRQGIEEQSLQR